MTLSIRHYVAIFTSIIMLLTAAFIYQINANINETHEKIIQSQSTAAAGELNNAIELMFDTIKKSALQLANWQEVKQQINNPEIFAYWYSVRFKKFAFDLQKYTRDFMIYDANGNALSLLDDINLPPKAEVKDIAHFQFKITDSQQMIYIIPVYSESSQTIIGYISSRINFIPYLSTIIQYQFIDPKSFKVKTKSENSYRSTLSSNDFDYLLHQSTHLAILEKQMASSLLGMVFSLVIPVITSFIAIIFLIGRPVKDVVKYINNLHENPDTPIPYNKSGFKIKELSAIYNEIRKYSKELGQKEQNLSLTLNSIAEAVITTDNDHRILSLNPVAESLTGLSQAEAINRPVTDIIRLEETSSGKGINYIFSHAIKSGVPVHPEHDTTLISFNGRRYNIDFSISPILDKTKNTHGLVAIFNDITELRLKEQQLQHSQKMDALGKLTGGIAHDFNNMLGIILGYTEILKLKTPAENKKLTKYIDEIIKAASRSRNLIARLLTFSRKEQQQARLSDINKLISSEEDMLTKTLTARIKLILDLTEQPLYALIDPGQFQDTILNLSINAMHAMPDGGDLLISTRKMHLNYYKAHYYELDSGDFIQVIIQDTGNGMDKETLKKIFDPFFTTKGKDGTGLGLSQVYGFIKQSKGAIDARSEIGKGTTFSLFLPLISETHAEENIRIIDDHQPGTSIPGNSVSILVVDDEEALLDIAKNMLEQSGYNVVTAASANEAMTKLASNSFDLVISDIIMPETDGFELARKIKRRYPELNILLMSGYSKEPAAGTAENKLYQQRLSKPFSSDELLNAVHSTLEHRNQTVV